MDPSIAEITITPELWVRQAHPSDAAGETAAMRRLADTMATDPSKIFDVCVELALDLCRADTCGISLLERTDAGEDIFRWIALAGQLKQHLHGTTPRFFSPCGICVDNSTPLLMKRPELVYKYLDVGPPFHDVLLIPLADRGRELEGTIWIVSHNPAHQFDLEDARVMQRIAVFTATALRLTNVAEEAKAKAAEQKLLPRELDDRAQSTLRIATGLLPRQGSVFPVEIRIDEEAALTAHMSAMREWLDHRRFEPATFRHSHSSAGFILRVEFTIEAEALAFENEFDGQLVRATGRHTE